MKFFQKSNISEIFLRELKLVNESSLDFGQG